MSKLKPQKNAITYSYPECVIKEDIEIYPNHEATDNPDGKCEEHNANGVCKGNNPSPKLQKCKFDFSCVGRNCKGVRFWIEIPLKKRPPENTTVVIMKNPSKATKTLCDKTIQNVINYLYSNRKDIGKILILNLMPIYMTDSKKLRPDHICPLNIECIECITKRHKDVIIAWGNKPAKFSISDYNSLSNKVVNILRSNACKIQHVGPLNIGTHKPKHGLMWRSKYTI